jgi:AmmeMemoRadiSam system protein B
MNTVPSAGPQERGIEQLLDGVGLKPVGDKRGQMDMVGFASTAGQMDEIMRQCRDLAAPRLETLQDRYPWVANTPIIAGVCPHDDHGYAGRLYTLLLSRVQARRIILFGVFHKARVFDCRDRLVFDSYRKWHGPYGSVEVSSLREDLIEKLPEEDYVINNDMQMVEHSVEAIVPFLQAYNRDVEIVSILVPYMEWDIMEKRAEHFSRALSSIMKENGWELGKDVCMIASADAVHYGDAGWGDRNFAAFGTDVLGYQMAVKRDMSLAENHLCGPIDEKKLEGFLYRCVDPEDVTNYLITWCGRFSIPFGLSVASRVTKTLESRVLTGTLLDYGTSVSEVTLDVNELDGMGFTAPNNFHHFVGYAAIGYW